MKEVQLDADQAHAVEVCLQTGHTHRIKCVIGEAGTGKTTIEYNVYKAFTDAGYQVALAAFTGKAAKRIHEVTGIQAQTIHKLLRYPRPGEVDEETGKPLEAGIPAHNRSNRLPYDVIMIDEYAMVPSELHRNLLNAVPPGGLVRCFGDLQQLQPIEESKALAGKPSPFERLVEKYETVELKTIHRQGEGSGILLNARNIARGKMPKNTDDFQIKLSQKPQDTLLKLIKESGIDFTSLSNQIITPTRTRGWISSNKLNPMIRMALGMNRKDDLELPRSRWYKGPKVRVNAGDKVIHTTNNYNLNVFNGEMGVITGIYPDGTLSIDFGDRVVLYPVDIRSPNSKAYDPRTEIELAYVITCHKSQGSEFDNVVFLMNRGCLAMLCRPMLYTAVTRAKRHCTVVTDHASIKASVNKMKAVF